MASCSFNLCSNNTQTNGGQTAGWIKFSASSGLDLVTGLLNGSITAITGQDTKWVYRVNIDAICQYGCDYQTEGSFKNVACFQQSTQVDLDDLNNRLLGKTVEVKVIANCVRNSVYYEFPLAYFYKENFPLIVGNRFLVTSDRCLSDMPEWGSGTFSCTNKPINNNDIQNIKSYSFSLSESVQCSDMRSSSSTSEFLITINGQDIALNNFSSSYNLLIQPDSSHTSGIISFSDSDPIYTGFRNFYGASCRMIDNICCHGVGYIEIRGDIKASCLVPYSADEGIYLPLWKELNRIDVLFLRANFDDECCCYATSYTDEVQDIVNNWITEINSYGTNPSMVNISLQCKSIKWSGFSRLSNFCCDESDCAEINEHDYEIELPSSGGGGGDNVDITCICDNLQAINNTLLAFKSSNELALESINDTLAELDINLDNECICDNLEEINDSLGAIKTSIDDKEIGVDNVVNVSPCQPVVQVTNPVNNITVTPSTAEITVEPCSPVVQVTNPVNNITVTPSTAEITVEPCQPTIQNVINEGDVIVDNDDLIEKLDELFKKEDNTITDIIDDVFKTTYQGLDGEMHSEDITEVIRNKQCENVVECIVEPVNMAYEGKGKYIDKDIQEQN